MRTIVALVAVAALIATVWWQLGRARQVAGADPGRIQCVSYAPFAADQSPLDDNVRVDARQIEGDLAKLSGLTDCVRTYASSQGIDQVPPAAEKLGMKVIQGLWLGRDRVKNRAEIDRTIDLAKRYRNTVSAIVVGNEVLLRGELAAADIGAIMHEVKMATQLPVTYADVWEFWLRNRDLAADADFITIHILPYWEDFPISAEMAGAHVDAIRSEVAAAFPGKDILIGEVGWPSAGRMREGALPSPSNQARVLEEVMARARAKHYRVNLIEAFDQPWKRQLEGTVGGYWGLLTAGVREPKFAWGAPVSDHPWWVWQLSAGILVAFAVFAGASAFPPRAAKTPMMRFSGTTVLAIGASAVAAGICAPWAVEKMAIESLGPGGWLRGTAFVMLALTAPVTAVAATTAGVAVPSFARSLSRAEARPRDAVAWASGIAMIATTVLALQAALGLVFDPRYRDFPFAALTAAIVPLAVAVRMNGGKGRRGPAETVAAATLAACAVYIALNESLANWQALWFAALLMLLAVTLFALRDVQGT